MKIIRRIMVILIVAAVVAGAFNLAFGSSTSNSAGIGEFLGHQEGGEGGGGSFGTGLLGVLITFIKLAGMVGLVVAIQNGIKLLLNQRQRPAGTV